MSEPVEIGRGFEEWSEEWIRRNLRAYMQVIGEEMEAIAGPGASDAALYAAGPEAEARVRARGEWRPAWDRLREIARLNGSATFEASDPPARFPPLWEAKP